MLICSQAENLANHLGLFVIKGHLAQAVGGDPFVTQADFLGNVFLFDAFGDLDDDDFFSDVVAVHV